MDKKYILFLLSLSFSIFSSEKKNPSTTLTVSTVEEEKAKMVQHPNSHLKNSGYKPKCCFSCLLHCWLGIQKCWEKCDKEK